MANGQQGKVTQRKSPKKSQGKLSYLWIRQRLHFKIKEKTNLKGKLIIKGKGRNCLYKKTQTPPPVFSDRSLQYTLKA